MNARLEAKNPVDDELDAELLLLLPESALPLSEDDSLLSESKTIVRLETVARFANMGRTQTDQGSPVHLSPP